MLPLPFLHGRWKDLNILFPKIPCRMNLFLRSSPLLDFIQLQCRLNDRMEGSENRSVNLGNRKISCQVTTQEFAKGSSFCFPYQNVKGSNLFSKTWELTELVQGRIKAVILWHVPMSIGFYFLHKYFSLLQ